MAGGANAPAQYVVVGANHRSSTVSLRDRIFVEDGAAPAILRTLVGHGGLTQALLLSTCDRVEVQGVAADGETARLGVAAALGERAGLDAAALASQLYLLTGEAAARHIFAVAASLDSAVLGEPQVLGQVKAAHRLARDAGTLGSELEAALQAAYGAAKRVRSETAIAAGAVSLVATAVQLAREVHGSLGALAGMLIGAGDMGLLLAEELRRAGLGRLTVCDLKPARAEILARQLDAHYAELANLAAALTEADVVIACAGTGRYLITGEMMEQVLRRRRRRPVYLIDLGVPSDIEPAVNRVDDAYLYDLGDLERVALASHLNRAAAAADAWRILDEETAAFLRQRAERAAVPTLAALRRRFEVVREEILGEARHADAAEATRLLVNRLLHDPSEAMRAYAAEEKDGKRLIAEHLLRQLFRLEGASDGRPRSGEKEK
ncbi:MAG TPA: glutamyl-tRNA reductase [Alphaproteobacteria bacterium]|nr:glutamyl-tRNA reductase [Alphaproteobacteria bacterium]